MPHSYCCLLYHLVFSTKDRRPDLTVDIRQRFFSYTGGIIRSENGVLLKIGGTEDHVHLLARLRQDRALSEQLRDIKSKSSRWIHETFPDKKAFGWHGGYGAFAVSRRKCGTCRSTSRTRSRAIVRWSSGRNS